MVRPDERYQNMENREKVQTGSIATQPRQELHLRVTTLEGEIARLTNEVDSAHAHLSTLSEKVDSVFSEVGLS